MNDRIRLAEAMGWEWQPTVDQPNNPKGQWLSPEKGWLERSLKDELLPDPESDANDDYAVLEWMRERCGLYLPDGEYTREQAQEWKRFISFLDDPGLYEIGDNARAALKVLE